MARSLRDIPKAIAAFGEKQFSESGAALVEVLRVKAATIRKYFKQIKGIAFLVAVVNLDRVRIYFFNLGGTLLVAENLDPTQYDGIRRKSKLVIKFEKPKPPTELELRMEATEDLRSALSKAIRRIARSLGQKEPNFPDIYVTKELFENSGQNFGLRIDDDGTLLFEESAIQSEYKQGIIYRAAFSVLMDPQSANFPVSSCVGNAIAAVQMKGEEKTKWISKWIENTSDGMMPLFYHFINHLETYKETGFLRHLDLLKQIRVPVTIENWMNSQRILHNYHELSLGTEVYHLINGFCSTLSKPRKLLNKRHILDSIHLAPRAICNVIPLEIHLTPKFSKTDASLSEWLNVRLHSSTKSNYFSLVESQENPIISIHYFLNIEDIFPKSGGLLSQGRSIISWALAAMGLNDAVQCTFESELNFVEKDIPGPEKAILERLSMGSLSILANTLLGSPQRIESLINLGSVIFLPDFNHIGIQPNFMIQDSSGDMQQFLKSVSLEYTLFRTKSNDYAIVSSPSIWGLNLLEVANERGCDISPIISLSSQRNIVRSENIFPEDQEHVWN